VSIDKVTHAYELAERHRDFTSLVTLSHSPLHGSPQRIQFFIHKYDQDFAFEFFRYLVEAKKLKELVECEEECRVLLTKFFDETKYPREYLLLRSSV
jgi:nuclear pore complex protein Nup133